MKKKVLAISIITIMLCVAVIAGATFALFTDNGGVDIAVTSGKVSVSAAVDTNSMTLYSPASVNENGEVVNAENAASQTAFANGGTAKVDEYGALYLSGLTPGDKAEFQIKITNNSDVNYKQRVSFALSSGDEVLYAQLLVGIKTQEDGEYDYYTGGYTAWESKSASTEEETLYVTVELPAYTGNSAKGKQCALSFSVEAVQGNATVTDGEAGSVYFAESNDEMNGILSSVKDGDKIVLAGSASAWESADVEITFTGEKTLYICGFKAGSITVNAPDGTVHVFNDANSITGAAVADESLHVYGKIGALTLNSGRAVVEESAVVSDVNAIPSANSAAIVVLKASVQKVSVDTSAENSSSNLTVEENAVVPELSVTGGGDVKIENNGTVELSSPVDTAAELSAALQLGGTIDLAGDIYFTPDTTLSSGGIIPLNIVTNDTVLNLNGYKIALTGYEGITYAYTPAIISVDGAEMTINGDGCIDPEAGENNSYGIDIVSGGSLTINGGSYYGAITAVQVEKGSLVVNNGYFELSETVKAQAPQYAKYLINCIDANYNNGTAAVTIYGGKFLNFDPAHAPETGNASYLAEGLDSSPAKQGDDILYTVVDKDYVTPWDGAVDSSALEKNTNSSAKTVTIKNAAQLAAFASAVNGGNSYSGYTVTLAKDIDLNGMEWTPIGNAKRSGSILFNHSFKGTFDGNNKTIYGLKISVNAGNNEDFGVGLFNSVSGGTIKNFTLDNVNVSVSDSDAVAAVAGFSVSNSVISGVTVSGSVSGKDGVGGIVGRMLKEGSIENCSNSATVTANGKAGGIVGAAYYTDLDKYMNIAGCSNTADITSTTGYIGGIVGMNCGNISGCDNSGDVTGNGTSVGGIVGEQQNYGDVTYNTNSGNIVNKSEGFGTGGIVGWVRYSGDNSSYTLKDKIDVTGNNNSGSVSGGKSSGGIVGHMYNAGSVTGNVNTAASISSGNFAAGIVGSLQYADNNFYSEEESGINVEYNTSTTPIESISGLCKDLYAYNNDKSLFTVENNSATL